MTVELSEKSKAKATMTAIADFLKAKSKAKTEIGKYEILSPRNYLLPTYKYRLEHLKLALQVDHNCAMVKTKKMAQIQ